MSAIESWATSTPHVHSSAGLRTMMPEGTDREALAVHRIDENTWLIQDLAFPSDDARHVVACVHDAGEAEVEVVWVQTVPLPARYATARDVCDDLLRWRRQRGAAAMPPVSIAHFPPARG